MREGDVALAAVPQADQRPKNRPVVILREMPLHRDLLVCGISTKLANRVANFDEIISPTEPDFSSSGLLAESLIRLSFLALVPRNQIVGSIGRVSAERHRRLLRTLAEYLMARLSS